MDSATDIKQRAQRLIRRGDFAQAMQQYQRLAQEESVDPNVHILIGDLHLRMGQRDGAVEEYDKAADGYDGLGLLRNAIAVHKKVLRVQPRHPSAHRRLADLYARKGHLTESVGHYLDHAALRLEGDDEETAREVLEQVTQLSTPSARVALRLADLYLALGERGRAVHELQRLARELEERGRPDQARKLLDQACTIDPELSAAAADGVAEEPAGVAEEPTEVAAEPTEVAAELAEEPTEVAAVPETDPLEAAAEPSAAETGPALNEIMPGLERAGDFFSPAPSPVDEATDEPVDAPLEHVAEHEETAVISSESDTWQSRLRCLLESGDEQGAIVWLDRLAGEAEVEGRHDEAITLLERLWELGRCDRDMAYRLVGLTAERAPADRAVHWLAELAELDLRAGNRSAARAGYSRVLELDDGHALARRRLARLDHLEAETTTVAEREEPGCALHPASELDVIDPPDGERATDLPPGGEPLGVDDWVAGLPERDDDAMPTPDQSSEEDQIDRLLTRFRQDIGEQLGDEDHAAHYDLALAYVEMGLEREALSELQLAGASPDHRQRCLELQATCYSRLGEPNTAVECLRVALEEIGPVDSRGADLRVRLGTALMEAGSLNEARHVLRGVIDQHPTHADARSQLEALGG